MGPFIRHSTTVSGLKKIDVADNARRFKLVANQAVTTLVDGSNSVDMFNANKFAGTPFAANRVVAAAAA